MGSVLGSCFGSCVGSCALGACTSCCSCKCLASPSAANIIYVAFIVLGTVAGVILRYTGVDLSVGASIGTQGVSVCVGNSTECYGNVFSYSICNAENCKGYWAVYRISFALTGFFFVMMLFTACSSRCSSLLHRGYWFAKVLFLIGVLIGTLFAPNTLFAYFAWVARFIAPFFLLYQILVFIDFGYSINARIIEKDEAQDLFFGCDNGGNKYKILILIVAILVYVGCLTAIGVLYARWPQDCSFNSGAITTTLLFNLINTTISISSIAEHGSILCSGLVFAYTTFLCYSALNSLPADDCNPSLAEDGEHVGWLIVSVCVAAVSIAYIAYRVGSKEVGANALNGGPSKAAPIDLGSHSSNGQLAGGVELGGSGKAASHDEVAVTVQDQKAQAVESADEAVEGRSYLTYHLKMALISVWVSMVLTDWGVPASMQGDQRYSVGYASAWLQLVSNWICCLLYFWTLIAVKACPNRDFGS